MTQPTYGTPADAATMTRDPAATPPRGGGLPDRPPNTAIATLQKQYDDVQRQLDALYEKIRKRGEDDPSQAAPLQSETALIKSYTDRLTVLAQRIAQEQSRAPTVIGGQQPTEKFIVRMMPDGTIQTDPNPNWDQKTEKAQVFTSGNRVFTVGTDGSVTVAYTDQDAQELARRQTAVAEKNAETSRLQAAANTAATEARMRIEERVANGETAAEARAQVEQELQRIHQEWVRADADARAAREQERDYNTERHNQAAETLARDQFENTKAWQEKQDAIAREGLAQRQREAEMSQKTAMAQTRAGLANQRLSTGAGYAGNVLSLLGQLNRDVAPGSDAVGAMLAPLLMLGQEFFRQMGGLESPDAILATQSAAAAGQPAAAAANPQLPGSAAPGVTPQAAAQQALTTPLAPDGSPYATPDYVAQKLAERRQPQQMPDSNLQAAPTGPLMG